MGRKEEEQKKRINRRKKIDPNFLDSSILRKKDI